MTNKLLDTFFSKQFENKINMKMMNYDYMVPINDINEYIQKIINIPIIDFVNYVKDNYLNDEVILSSKDAIQFSSFVNTNKNILLKIKMKGDKGFQFKDIGKFLLDDNIPRKDGAYTKYGENHAKTAEYFGLLYNLKNTYFLSCIGYVYNNLTEDDQTKLLTRLILRTNFLIKIVLILQKNNCNMREIFSMLSDSTYYRRKSNIKFIIKYLITNNIELIFLDNIQF